MAGKEAICSLTFSTLSTTVLLFGGLTCLSKNLTTLESIMSLNTVSICFEDIENVTQKIYSLRERIVLSSFLFLPFHFWVENV